MKNIIAITLLLFSLLSALGQSSSKIKNVILVTLDGYRWQELFGGIDSAVVRSEYTRHPQELLNRFWAEDAEERTLKLNPFFEGLVSKEGIILGNRRQKSFVNCTNKQWFSYPGYNEILSGKADDERIRSNDFYLNPNITFLESLNTRKPFKGKVVAFTSWDAFDYIIHEERSGVMVNAGFEKVNGNTLINKIQENLPVKWPTVRYDALTHYQALTYTKENHPRAVYISYGETDDFAHEGEYDEYVKAAYRTNEFLIEWWTYIQSDKFYKDKTVLIVTTDHGRGTSSVGAWRSHGASVEGADQIWMAFLGPGINPGQSTEGQFHQSQVAATIMTMLGFQWEHGRKIPLGIK